MGEIKISSSDVHIPAGHIKLDGTLVIPDGAESVVIFSHGSGSSRHSPRNKFVSRFLNQHGFATLMFDLLTKEEEKVYNTRFDIDLLMHRLLLVTDWVKESGSTSAMDVGYFGSSTGAASALAAASMLGSLVNAVVSRGGRPDLAGPYLAEVKAPTLLLVGEFDQHVVELNKTALDMLDSTNQMKIIPGASHLFEESGKLEEVAGYATAWFTAYMKHPDYQSR